MQDAPQAGTTRATIKTLLVVTWIPLTITFLLSQMLRFSALSIDVSILLKVLWFLPEVFALAGLLLLGVGAMVVTKKIPALQTLLFSALTVIGIFLLCLELAAINFAFVTGSLLDAEMLHYAFANVQGSWDLINESTPTFLKIIIAVAAFIGLITPHVLRRKLTEFDQAASLPTRKGVMAIALGLVLNAIAFFIAGPVSTAAYPDITPLPGTYAIARSLLPREIEQGQVSALSYSTAEAELVPKPGTKPRNVVLILLESTRASATTPYNPDLPTTPYLQELSQQSLLAEQAYVVTPHTSKAVLTTGCGVDPFLGVDIMEASQTGIPHRCMARLFSDAGYATAFFQSATQRFEHRPNLVQNMGFEEFYPLETFDKKGFDKVNYFGVEDDIMVKPSIDWAKKQEGKPFFMTYLTLTPHHDYLAPRRYGRHQYDTGNEEFNRYLNSVHYVDNFVKNVIEEFKKNGLYEDTVFAVLGDHGEGFGEHKRYQHDKVIYQEGLTIPFIVHDPQDPTAKRITHPVNQLDLMPTLLELSRHQLVHGTLPGLSLVSQEVPPDRPLKSYCWSRNTCMALVRGKQKYIYFFDRQPDEFYDLEADPEEKKSLPKRIVPADKKLLLDWLATTNQNYYDYQQAKSREFISDSPPEELPNPTSVMFGDAIELIGYDILPRQASRNENVTVTLHFKVLKDMQPGWRLFMHGLDARKKMRNLDHVPLGGALPVEQFEAGQYITDEHTFRIRSEAQKGPYTILVGFWHEQKGRMPVKSEKEQTRDNDAIKLELLIVK